jgi:hypothetical protein
MGRKFKGGAEGDSSFFWPFVFLLFLIICGGAVGIAYAAGAFTPPKGPDAYVCGADCLAPNKCVNNICMASGTVRTIPPIPVIQTVTPNAGGGCTVSYLSDKASGGDWDGGGATITFTGQAFLSNGTIAQLNNTTTALAGTIVLPYTLPAGVSVTKIVVNANGCVINSDTSTSATPASPVPVCSNAADPRTTKTWPST